MGMTYQRGAVWWIKYYQNGRGMRESSHSTKESKAKTLLKLREGDIEHGLPVANQVLQHSRERHGVLTGRRLRIWRRMFLLVREALCHHQPSRFIFTLAVTKRSATAAKSGSV